MIITPITLPVARAITGTPPPSPHVQRFAVFNGTTSNVSIGDNSVFDWTNKLSVSCRAKHDLSDILSTSILMSKYNSSQKEWGMGFLSSEKLVVYMTGNNSSIHATTATNAITTNVEHSYGFIYDGTADRLELYIDGLVVPSGRGATALPAAIFNGTAQVRIGMWQTTLNPWQGRIDNVKTHKGVWSAAQMLAASTRHYAPSNAGYYALEFDARDRSGNGLHGTNTNVTFGP